MTYRVVVTREGRNWLAAMPELEGASTFAKSLVELERYVREVVGLALDLPGEEVYAGELAWEYRLGDADLDASVAALPGQRAHADDEQRKVAVRTAAAAQVLRARRISTHDTARILGVSPQRISQVAPRRAG